MCFLEKLNIFNLCDFLKSPKRRGNINWIDRLAVIQEMVTLKLDIKFQS